MNPVILLKYLRNPFILAVTLGVLVVISFIVDAKINNRDRDRTDYLKLFGTIIATSLTTHFYLKSKPSSQYGGAPQPHVPQFMPDPITHNSPYTSADVFADTPNF